MKSLAPALGAVGLGSILSFACSSPVGASVPHPPGTISDEAGIVDVSDTVLTLGPNGTLLAGWMVLLESGRAAGRFRLSPDRGDTWSLIYPLVPRVGQDIGAAASPVTLTGTNPTDSAALPMLWVSGAHVGVAFVETDASFTTTQLSFRRSDDHGASWPGSSSVVISEAGDPLAYGQPDCAMDETGALVLYQVSDAPVRAASDQAVNHIVSLRLAHLSTEGQIDFRTQVTSAEEGGQFASPRLVLGQDGRVDVVYYGGADLTDPASSLRVRSSTDGARTFAAPVTLESGIALGATGHGWLGSPAAVRDGTSLLVAFANNIGGPAFVKFLRTP
jgi:hypothetical protein